MNLLAHFYLAEHSGTSYAGQVLGDIVKGRLDDRYAPAIRDGIRLHRAIDRVSDDHPSHAHLRGCFAPPFRRYAGILVDIGFDYSLARDWRNYSSESLPAFARHAERQVRGEWPAEAPFGNDRMAGLARILTGYERPDGLQRALDSVTRRLRRASPVARALPQILANRDRFDAHLPVLMADLQQLVREHRA